jgi:hypothetical protein
MESALKSATYHTAKRQPVQKPSIIVHVLRSFSSRIYTLINNLNNLLSNLLRNIVNVGYNILASSDARQKLLVEYDTGSVNDTHALADMAIHTKELLKVDKLDVLADKGYHTGEELEKCKENDITSYVSPKASSSKVIGLYPVTDFTYERQGDVYVCPKGKVLRTNTTWYHHSIYRKGNERSYRFRRFTKPACNFCESRNLCTYGKNGRYIDRSEFADAIEANAQRVNANPDYYRRRQQITLLVTF